MNDEASKPSFIGDLKRMGIALVIIAILNLIDIFVPMNHIAYMTSVLTSTSIVIFIAAASHVMRRIFFPNVSMTELVNEAKAHPIGAAICFFGISVILSALIVVNVLLLGS